MDFAAFKNNTNPSPCFFDKSPQSEPPIILNLGIGWVGQDETNPFFLYFRVVNFLSVRSMEWLVTDDDSIEGFTILTCVWAGTFPGDTGWG
jgi:hypothetical protein